MQVQAPGAELLPEQAGQVLESDQVLEYQETMQRVPVPRIHPAFRLATLHSETQARQAPQRKAGLTEGSSPLMDLGARLPMDTLVRREVLRDLVPLQIRTETSFTIQTRNLTMRTDRLLQERHPVRHLLAPEVITQGM